MTTSRLLKATLLSACCWIPMTGFGTSSPQASSFAPDFLVSGKQKIYFSVKGDCVDWYDEEQDEYLIYEGEDCDFVVRVVPPKPVRTVALQFEDDGWYVEVEKKTNKSGIAIMSPRSTDSKGNFLCDSWYYRLGVARLGAAKAVLSDEFIISFVCDDY